jgi:hypothetical protein
LEYQIVEFANGKVLLTVLGLTMLYWLHAVWEDGYEYNNMKRKAHYLLQFAL